jgi:hypothetical protein
MRAGVVQMNTVQIDTVQINTVQTNTVRINTEPLWRRQLVWCDWRDERGYLRPLRGGTSPAHRTDSPTPMR